MPRNLRPIEAFPITTRFLEVIRSVDVTPGMRRVTLGGAELAAHTAVNGYPVGAFRSEGFDDEFKILLKHPDAAEAVGPAQADGVLDWPREDPHMVLRTYTVRRWDPVRGEIDVDFVRHGVGPATSWAYRVQPGERVQVAGPKMSMGHPDGADWTLIAGDETALPAIGRWLEQWPKGARAQVFIEVAESAHRQELAVPPGVDITWLSRDGAEPGTTTLLFDAIRDAAWPEGRVFAWVAGEALTLVPIRRWLRQEKGLDKEQVEVTGYWRRQAVVVSAEDASMPDFDATGNDAQRLHELSEIAPGFALRVAATIGLALAFDRRDRTVAELADATGADPEALGKLLRYLEAIGVTERLADGRYRLTDLGRQLEDDRVSEALDAEGPVAHRELGGLLSLLSAVRTGVGDYPRWFGEAFARREEAEPARLAGRLEQETERAVYMAGAVASALTLPAGASVTVTGRGPGSFAEAIVQRHPGTRVELLGSASELRVLQGLHSDRVGYAPGSIREPLAGRAHAVLLADALRSLPDADAVDALRGAAASIGEGGQVLLFTQPLNPELADDHAYEDDLIEFALHGGGLRTHEEHLALFAAAGLAEPARTTVGWGYTLYTSVRG